MREQVFSNELDGQQDIADALQIFDMFAAAVRCPGGRIVADGYMCIHCGKDPGEGDCGKPKRGRGRARRQRAAKKEE